MKNKKQLYDIAYDGFEHAINNTPMLKNPDSMRRLAHTTGVGASHIMRTVARQKGEIRETAKEVERKKAENRLSELKQLSDS
jgi:adenylosuccinate lyase